MPYTPSAADFYNPLDTIEAATAAAEFRALKKYLFSNLVFNVLSYGAVGNGVANDKPGIDLALAAVPDTGGILFFPPPTVSYRYEGLNGLKLATTIVAAGAFVVGQPYTIESIGTTDFTLVGAAANTVGLLFTATGVGAGTGTAISPKNKLVIFTPYQGVKLDFPTVDAKGVVVNAELGNTEIHNLLLTASGGSIHNAIESLKTTTVNKWRDFLIKEVSCTDFLSGFVIYGYLNGRIVGGRQTGQGKGVANGVGIQLGQDAGASGNVCRLENVYPSNYETNIWNKYASPTTLSGTVIPALGAVGLRNSLGQVNGRGAHLYLDQNDVAIRNNESGYLNWSGHFSSLGVNLYDDTVINLGRTKHLGIQSSSVLSVNKGAVDQVAIVTATATDVSFGTDEVNADGEFVSPEFTAPIYALYKIRCQITWQAGVAYSMYELRIYKNGAQYALERSQGLKTVPDTFAQQIERVVALKAGDKIKIVVFHNEGVNSAIQGATDRTWLQIEEV